MLRVALPNKGSLAEQALQVVRQAGYSCRAYDRELSALDVENDVEFIFLRPRDIAVYVGGQIIDLGITGRDLVLDSQSEVAELLPLGFAKSSFCFAVPKDSALTPEGLDGKRIATSYPNVVGQHLKKLGLSAQIIRLDGAVEISVQLGVADAIADVVQSGRTLEQAGLKIVGQPLVQSEAVLIGRSKKILQDAQARTLFERIQGIVVAAEYAMIEYDCPKAVAEQACAITPGIESPTISPLHEPDWIAIKSMVKQREINRIMDQLKALGAKGIIATEIRTCRM